nr:hypothetical protein [uncultured Gellertiella sp.]
MKTVSGLFDTYAEGQSAVRALEDANISRDAISIIANNGDTAAHHGDGAVDGAETGAGLGAIAGGAGGLLAGLGMLAIPGIGPVVAAGWLATTIAGMAAGAIAGGAAGGIIGALTESGVPEEDASVYAEGIRRGGTLVTARVEEAVAPTVARVLDEAKRVDVAGRRQEYAHKSWQGSPDNKDGRVPVDAPVAPGSGPTGGVAGRL